MRMLVLQSKNLASGHAFGLAICSIEGTQLEYEYQLETESAEALLGTLRRLDKERVAQSVRLGTQANTMSTASCHVS